ncbi:MAG: hypothetical protein IPM25_13850 [Chloracidobacterium sp.]|nr:hypothetical protein [Chloracidobacterium sp.]
MKKVQAISGSILPFPGHDTKPDIEMQISLSGLELTVKETVDGRSRTSKYFIDGRGEINSGFTSNFTYESKTQLKGRKVKFERSMNPFKDTVVWELSKDGKKLTVDSPNDETLGESRQPQESLNEY